MEGPGRRRLLPFFLPSLPGEDEGEGGEMFFGSRRGKEMKGRLGPLGNPALTHPEIHHKSPQ